MFDQVIDIAREAGRIVLKYYGQEYRVEYKDDAQIDPVTTADYEADDFIRKKLSQAFPDDKVLSEEAEHDDKPQDYNGNVWMVDPLDGTKNFVKGKTGFCVMIGLCRDGVPVLGVVYAPVSKELYYAGKGSGAWYKKANSKPVRMRVASAAKLSDAVKVKTGDKTPIPKARLRSLKTREVLRKGSTGLKICTVASGKAHVFLCPYLTTSKWDVCAPQVILKEAGGRLTFLDGKPLDYKQESPVWGKPFLASNNKLHEEALSFLSESYQNKRT